MYYPELGRWMAVDPLAEADEDFSPYLYTSNNPILNIDLFGLTDVTGDGKDDGTLLPEVTVTAKRSQSTLNNIQLALDVVGLYPAAGTVAGIINGGIDIYRGNYGSAGLNFLSAIPLLGTAMKGTKFAVMGAKAMSSMAKMKVVKSALAFTYKTLPSVKGMQKHHILPKALLDNYNFRSIFKQAGFNINEGRNIMYLDEVFHGNHPEYTERVAERLTEIIQNNNGTLTIGDIKSVISEFKKLTNEAATDWKQLGGPNLNDAFRW